MMRLKMKNTRGQMKIQQMAFMLMAVTLFLILAGLFIITIRFSGLKESAELLEEKEALLLASKVADSSEFSCGGAFAGTARGNCIDTDKVIALKERISEYTGFWSVDGIEIRWIYPSGTGEECSLDNYPGCDKITLVESQGGTGISNFVSLCRKENRGNLIQSKCELGKIIVKYGE